MVGAGPAGLTAALELARRHQPVRIIEAREGHSEYSRALSINTRSMELMEECGITERWLALGIRVSGVQYREPTRSLFRIDYTTLKHRYNFMLVLPQIETEAVIEESLNELGIKVERNAKLIGFEQTPDGIEANIRTAGAVETITASYLIGADGANSIVRKTAGIRFPGVRMPRDWSLADVRMRCPWDPHDTNILLHKNGMLFMLGYKDGIFRLGADAPTVLDALPGSFEIDKVLWESSFAVNHRQVTTYRAGRVLLAGDAAHVHAPLGARGMNISIEDAVVLVRHLLAGEIERYSPERLEIGTAALRMIKAQTYLSTNASPMANLLRRYLVPGFLHYKPLERRLAGGMLGLG